MPTEPCHLPSLRLRSGLPARWPPDSAPTMLPALPRSPWPPDLCTCCSLLLGQSPNCPSGLNYTRLLSVAVLTLRPDNVSCPCHGLPGLPVPTTAFKLALAGLFFPRDRDRRCSAVNGAHTAPPTQGHRGPGPKAPAPSPYPLRTQLCSGAWLVHSFPIVLYLGVLVGVEAPWKAPFLTRLL